MDRLRKPRNQNNHFAVIVSGEMLLHYAGRMIHETWHEMPDHYPGIELDVMQIMPNDLHGIILVCEVGADLRVCPNLRIENRYEESTGWYFPSPSVVGTWLPFDGDGRARGPSPTIG